jgi:hypothetical protein
VSNSGKKSNLSDSEQARKDASPAIHWEYRIPKEEAVMNDASRYLACCQCFKLVLRDEAVRTEELYGGFCSEACVLLCLQINNPPRFIETTEQPDERKPGSWQFDDLAPRTGVYGQLE